jgi:hypothetical protein
MATPAPHGLRSAPAIRLVIVVGVVVTVAFLNLWLAVAIGVGFLVGEAARWLVRRLRHFGRRRAIAIAAAAVSVVLIGAAVAVLSSGFDKPQGASAPAFWSLPYNVEARYADNQFTVKEQVQVSPADVRGILGISGKRRLPRATSSGARLHELVLSDAAAEGWTAKTVKQNLVLTSRPFVVRRPVRLWPLSTSLTFPIRTLSLGPRRVSAVPDVDSTIDVFAAPGVIRRTTPPSSAEDWGDGTTRRHIALADAGGFAGDLPTTIRVEANSVLARNPVVRRIRDWTVWTPVLWLTAIVTALLSDAVKGWIKRVIRLGATEQSPRASGATT